MSHESCRRVNPVGAALLAAALAASAAAARSQEAPLTHEARGRFEVTVTPAAPPDAAVARAGLAKRWSGDLTGTSTGEMLSVGSPASGNAGYVAMERVAGALQGREGGFALQQSGTLEGGRPSMMVTVVPGSGTGALAGIAGSMTVDPAHGHAWVLRYTLPGG